MSWVGFPIVAAQFGTVVRYKAHHISVCSVHLCIFLSNVGAAGKVETHALAKVFFNMRLF